MDELHKSLNRVLRKTFSGENMIAAIFTEKLRKEGIVLSDEQQKLLRREIKKNRDRDTFSFRIDEEATLEFPSRLKDSDRPLSLAIDVEKDIGSINDKMAEIVERVIPKIAADASASVLGTLKKDFKEYQTYTRKQLRAFNGRIERIWGNPLDLLEMLYDVCTEAGDIFNHRFRPAAARKKSFVFDVVTRLHARACQIAAEIILLLRNGYADGAHARWRTLHEITVMAYFVAKHGNDIAERYICHTAIESYKAALKYQEHTEAVGLTKLSEEEVLEIKKTYQYLVHKYGTNYKHPYGWASSVLRRDNPTIADIEADVGLAFMRPYYKMASYNVHANPQGIFFKLGLIPENANILLTGPSSLGFADPGRGAAASLVQITTNLLTTIEPNFDRVVLLRILLSLQKEIVEAFYQADLRLNESTGG
jgi:hypothetical protein